MTGKPFLSLLFALTLCSLTSGSIASAQTGIWVRTGDMNAGRYYNTATLLATGKVLVAGGGGACSAGTCQQFSSAELYDPATKTWTFTSPMNHVRLAHTATLMQDGRVLVAGGSNITEGCLANAEIFDPTNQQWTETGAMSAPRCGHQAALITQGPNAGMVMVFSGSTICSSCEPVTTTAELYDPATGSWQLTGSLSVGRFVGGAVPPAPVLANGNIMAFGGLTCCPYTEVNEAEIYDVLAGEWTPTSAKTTGAEERAVTLTNGNVLGAGGWTGIDPYNQGTPDTELFDASSQVWSRTGPMSIDRFFYTLTTLASGQVLAAGGCDGGWEYCDLLQSAELYDPSSAAWFPTGSLNFARSSHFANLLPDGTLLVSGGYDPNSNQALSTAELYIPRPAVSLSNTSLNFGVQVVGASGAPRTTTLTDQGTGKLHITSIVANGDFSQQNNCGSAVQPGKTCTIRVGFKPTAKGSRTGAVIITDDAVNSPQTITLTGTGTVVALSTSSIDFGNQKVGTHSQPEKFYVSNVSFETVNITGIGLTGNFSDFVDTTTCGSSLAAGATCWVKVGFKPSTTGVLNASVLIKDDGGGSPQKVALAGTGTE